MLEIDLSLFTVVVGHATFCIVVVYNNVIARLRRVSGNLGGCPRRSRGAHVADVPLHHPAQPADRAGGGGLLAFALSFDEIIVTTFTLGAGDQTIPIWIFTNLFRGEQLPITNVVAVFVVLLSIIPSTSPTALPRGEHQQRGGKPVAGAGRGAPAGSALSKRDPRRAPGAPSSGACRRLPRLLRVAMAYVEARPS